MLEDQRKNNASKKSKNEIIEKTEKEVKQEPKEEKNPFSDYDKEEPEKIDITLNLNKKVQRYYSLNKHERHALLEEGYEIFRYKPMLLNKFEKYMVKPRFNESILHFFVIWDIQTFLESKDIEVNLFTTKKPDVIFELNKKSYAIEVETGSVLKRSKEQVIQKYKTMKREYDYGFIVVPSRRIVREYRKIVPAIDRRYLKNKLLKILKKNGF